jgi:hypothetical protein
MSDEQEDAKVRNNLQGLARTIDRQLPVGCGFVLLAFPFGADGRMNYVANANRSDVVRLMYEFIETTKEQWAEHEPELSAAAEDEQLGRARQRIAELEEELRKARHEHGGWWVIWSEEHRGWWGPNSCGYTRQLSAAGRYNEAQAKEIVARANEYCVAGTFNEVTMPDPMDQ